MKAVVLQVVHHSTAGLAVRGALNLWLYLDHGTS